MGVQVQHQVLYQQVIFFLAIDVYQAGIDFGFFLFLVSIS